MKVVVAIIAAAVFLLLIGIFGKAAKVKKGSPRPAERATKSSHQAKSPYRATSIVHDDQACEAVKAMGGKRFLEAEKNLPILPLPDCSVSPCNCKYVRYDDRRESNDDRRLPSSLQSELYDHTVSSNRRLRKRGRRKDDWA